jgi:iron-sulfur cluster insertion protein
MITLTDSAVKKIREIIAEEEDPNLKVRMFIQGGGCSGMQYGFTLEENGAQEDDFVVEKDGVEILVDSLSSQYVQGAEVDWQETVQGSQFAIKNPNASTTCGCGSSFSPS